jgi:hypothetical protein
MPHWNSFTDSEINKTWDKKRFYFHLNVRHHSNMITKKTYTAQCMEIRNKSFDTEVWQKPNSLTEWWLIQWTVTQHILSPCNQIYLSYNEDISQSQWPSGLRHGCLSVVIVVCLSGKGLVMGWSFVQRSPTDCVVSLCVISKPQEWGG